jgi:hypothetical protein
MHQLTRIAFLTVTCSAGCFVGVNPCVDGVDESDTLQVTIVRRWTDSEQAQVNPSAFLEGEMPVPCQLDDIEVGSTFVVPLGDEKHHAGECRQLTCPDDFPTASIEGDRAYGGGGSFVCENNNREQQLSDGCLARRFVALVNMHPDKPRLFDEPGTDGAANVMLVRSLSLDEASRGNPSCAMAGRPIASGSVACADGYVVTLKKR